MRLLVVGPGALGTLFATRLAAGGHRVFVRGRPGSAGGRRPRPPSFRIEGTDPVEAAVTWTQELPEPLDGVIVAVKSYDLTAACSALGPAEPVPLLLLQNGFGIDAAARSTLLAQGAQRTAETLVRAIVSLPATWIGPGVVRQAGAGEVLLPSPPPGPGSASVEAWDRWLTDSGITVRRVAAFDREVWRKLLVNAAINPVTADHGVENGRLAEPPWREQALGLLGEARRVAASQGHEFSAEETERDLFQVVRATAANRSSMLQDLDHGRPTEVEAISGAILRLGESAGLELPKTRRIVERLRRRQPAAPGGAPSKG